MPADDTDRRALSAVRFHSYADDTPRDDLDLEPVRLTPSFAQPDWEPELEPAPESEFEPDYPREAPAPDRRRGWWITGGGVAAVAGAVLALNLLDDAPPAVPPPKMAVEVATRPAPAPLPPPAAATQKLEVLPPPPPAQAVHPAPAAPVRQAQRDPAPRAIASAAPVPPARDVAATASQAPAEPRPAPQPQPPPRSFACNDLPTRAMTMVCGDARLARLDLKMKRAYQAALAAGASPRALRADQDDWLDVREDAAQVSRGSVANVYRQRIDELEDLALR